MSTRREFLRMAGAAAAGLAMAGRTLAAREPAKVNELLAKLAAWEKDVGPPPASRPGRKESP
jgi:hypothetical protein